VNGALEIGLKWLTVYAFSTENWRRPLDEVRFLMNFNERLLVSRRDELHEKGVRVRFIGRRSGRVPGRVRKRIEETEALTQGNRKLTLTFAFNYGGRAEIVDAARRFEGGDEEEFAKLLYAPEMHEPDVVIRTSGEQRMSNFLLWQSAYSELIFRDELWPDFTREAFEACLEEYASRRRRSARSRAAFPCRPRRPRPR
jgi:undecaprenyl diphosphate synthase